MTLEMQAVLGQAHDIAGQIHTLEARLKATLKPVVEQAIEDDNPDKTYELIQAIPPGAYRIELRTHHIKRMTDYEYRKRFNHPVNQDALKSVKR